MLRPRIRLARAIDVPEHQGVACRSAMFNSKAREARRASFEILVEIDEDCHNSLTIAGDLLAESTGIKEVAVQDELLDNGVMENLRHF